MPAASRHAAAMTRMRTLPRRCSPIRCKLSPTRRSAPGHKFGISILDGALLRVLLTNDDGIHADGLQTLRRALAALDDIELAVIAPDANQSATARSITTRRP